MPRGKLIRVFAAVTVLITTLTAGPMSAFASGTTDTSPGSSQAGGVGIDVARADALAARGRIHYDYIPSPLPFIVENPNGTGPFCQLPGCAPPLVNPQHNPVQHHPVIFLIFWGPSWSSGSQQATVMTAEAGFINALAGSRYNNVLVQYKDSQGHIANDTHLGGSVIDTSAVANPVGTAALGAEVVKEINANGWVNTSDSQFIVLTEPGSHISGSGFCAYHTVTNNSTAAVASLIPYPTGSFSACASAYGSGSVPDAITTVTSHEYAESATDPFIDAWRGSGTSPFAGEIGDLCAPLHLAMASLGNIVAQKLWSNRRNNCVGG